MAKYKCIRIELYKRDITVFIGSHEEFKEWIKTNDCTETWRDIINQILESDDNAEASYWHDAVNGNGIIELHYHPKSPKEIAVAAHECLHATMRILSFIGIPCFDNEANEPYTYLLEYILEQVLDFNNYKLINI
jgi:hypothetical protein|nr:MAG TPA: Putative neutral zinc metallopeptidase [Crassvirales sp.]